MRVPNRRVLVTGGAGYIGSHTAKALARAGFEPIVFDNLARGNERLVRFGPLIRGDLLDRAAIVAAVKEVAPVACLHFAAFAYVGESVQQPALYYRNNFAGSLNLFEALLEAGVRSVVFSSTCATYGEPHAVTISEEARQKPVNAYGRSKLFVEMLLRDLDLAFGLTSLTLRYFNACGADPEAEIGELHDPEPHLIPRALLVADGRLPHLEVFGSDFATPDGTPVRDYIHVSDLADGHVAALNHLMDGGQSEFVNLGTGRGHSVLQVVDAVRRVTGRAVDVVAHPRRPGDPPMLVADPTKAERLLGFSPRFTELDAMIDTAWRWHRKITK